MVDDQLLYGLIYLMARYLHIVCMTLLVGGTLFYEMVVPVAIGELRTEHQLAVFGRARWMFRGIVWSSAGVLVVTGVVQTWQHWASYALSTEPSVPLRSVVWWAAHTSTALIAIIISLFLTGGRTPPDRPVSWMRLNLVILLIVIFLASTTRHVRLSQPPPREANFPLPLPQLDDDDDAGSTSDPRGGQKVSSAVSFRP